MENAIDYKELLAHGIATKDFVRAEIAEVRTEIKAETAEVRTEIKAVENRLLNRLSVGAVLIIAAIIGGYFV